MALIDRKIFISNFYWFETFSLIVNLEIVGSRLETNNFLRLLVSFHRPIKRIPVIGILPKYIEKRRLL